MVSSSSLCPIGIHHQSDSATNPLAIPVSALGGTDSATIEEFDELDRFLGVPPGRQGRRHEMRVSCAGQVSFARFVQ